MLSLLFVIDMMSLNHMLRKCIAKYNFCYSLEKINHRMCMDDIKLFAKKQKQKQTKKQLKNQIYAVRIYIQDRGMGYGIENVPYN